MNNKNEKKALAEYKQHKPEQLKLFEIDSSLDNYSNSIELYDTMPKYYIGGVEREKGKMVESLPILNREFMHRNKSYKLNITPAASVDRKSGKTIYYYPSQREELVEDVLRKIATRGGVVQFDDKVGVKFTYYEVQQELKRTGHGYSITDIKLAIEILSKAGIEVISKDGNEFSMTSNFFTLTGKETKEMGGKERVVVTFHPLVTGSINQRTYRLFNYDRLMKMKMPLARWLHKRISHLFSQATVHNPYEIKLSTIVRDSGMKAYKTISERSRQVEKALNELKENKVITRFAATPENEKRKILDILYSLYMSEEFVADAKKANKLANLRLENGNDKKESFDIEELRKEIEKPLYGLTKTVISNCLLKIANKEEFDKIVNSLEAVKEYLKGKESRGEKVVNRGAITKAAIRDEWMPRDKEGNSVEEVKEIETQTLEIVQQENEKNEEHLKLQQDPIWHKIREKIRAEYENKDWEKWFSDTEIFSISEDKIVLLAATKFKRDWIIREFVERKGNQKTLADIVEKICPRVKNVSVICASH
jgi:hypothetical protein